MKKAKITTRELVMIIFLVILLVAVCYYMFFLTPLKEDMATIETQISNIETEKESHTEKLTQMNKMSRELAELKATHSVDELSQVAVYDNTVEVLSSLNQYMAVNCNAHTLNFVTPEIAEDGTVRRVVEMNFECNDYDSARAIIDDLTGNKWRCLVSDTTIATADEENKNVKSGIVTVSLTLTFFEISAPVATAE